MLVILFSYVVFDGAKLLLFCYFSYFLLFKNAKSCAFYCFLSQIYVFFIKNSKHGTYYVRNFVILDS